MTDQQRADAIGIAGKFPFLQTPNIDELARTGAYFTRAYTPSPSSAPARSSILTGESVENARVYSNSFNKFSLSETFFTTKPTFDNLLARDGYYCEYQGKWHAPIYWTDCYTGFSWSGGGSNYPNTFNLDALTEFTTWMAEKYSGAESYTAGDLYDSRNGAFYAPDPIDGRYFSNSSDFDLEIEDLIESDVSQSDNFGRLNIEDIDSDTSYTAQGAIEAIKRAKEVGRPFSITVSINYPHPPMVPSPYYYDLYNIGDMPVAASISDEYVDSPYSNPARKNVGNAYGEPDLIPYMMKNYFGLITEVDDWIGQILDTLEEVEERDNTIIVFMSDHGEMLGAHALAGKGNFYEESCRVPFIINYPKAIPARQIDCNVSTRDLYGTILDYMDISYWQVSSKSLRSVINSGTKSSNVEVVEWIIGDDTVPTHLLIKDDWKLLVNYSDDNNVTPALYNIAEDPDELTNYIGASNPNREEYLSKAQELQDDLVLWLKEYNSDYTQSVSEIEL